jgi:hypothetical protein
VLILDPIQDGTKVTVTAGNEENSSADVKNNVTEANAQMARFSDLRFVGKSGRGRDAKNSNRKESLSINKWSGESKKWNLWFLGPKNFLELENLFTKNDPYRGNFIQGIDCAHSEAWKRFLDPDSGNGVGVVTRKSKKFFSPVHQLHSINQGQDNFSCLENVRNRFPA